MILAYLLLIIMIVIWSFSFIMVDIAVEYIPPLSVALYRFLVASIAFLVIDIYLKVTKKYKEKQVSDERKFSRNDWILLLSASLTGVLLYFYTQHTAIELIGPSLPALFICLLSPVIIAILALFFFNEKLNPLKILGFIIATIGGFLLVSGGDISNLSPKSPNFLGYMFALAAPICFAIYSTLTKKITEKHSSFKMLKMISYTGTIELLIVVILNREFSIFLANMWNPIVLLSALYLGLAVYLFGYMIWQNSLKKIQSSKVASFLYVEPFLTLIFSFLLRIKEIIVFWNIMGGLIVLVAVLIINNEKKSVVKNLTTN